MAKYVWIENKDTASNNRQLYKVIMQGDKIVGYEKVIKYPPCTIVDEDYVNRKIEEANPVFKGTFNSMAEINAIGDANLNDWAYLRSVDSSGNVSYSRYRYTTEIGWIFEVAIKRDNFTDEEWAAITSGITSDKVQKMIIALEVSDITALTAAQIDSLKEGYVVNKVTGNSKHSYVVAYKNDTDGEMSLVYSDHENIEEVYYEKQGGTWTYVQTDITSPITQAQADARYIPTDDDANHSITFPSAEFDTGSEQNQ